MDRLENVNIIRTLEAIMRVNTAFGQDGFRRDTARIVLAASLGRSEDYTVLWASHPNGTVCCFERDAFLLGTAANEQWKQLCDNPSEPILAYAVHVNQVLGTEIHGTITEFDYHTHAERVWSESVEVGERLIQFEDGRQMTMVTEQYEQFDFKNYPPVTYVICDSEYPDEHLEIVSSERGRRRSNNSPANLKDHLQKIEHHRVESEALCIHAGLLNAVKPSGSGDGFYTAGVTAGFVKLACVDDFGRLLKRLPFFSTQLVFTEMEKGLWLRWRRLK